MSTLREAAEKALKALDVATTPLAKDRQEVLSAMAALRAALSAPAEPQEAAEPVVIAGRYTAYPQRGTPNHCFNAQVFGPDGLSVATFDSTADPRHAYRYAMALADALNAPAPQPAGGEPQPAAQQEQAEERKPLTDEQVLPLMKQAGLASKKCDSKPVATIEKTQPKPAQKKGPQ